MRDGDILTEGGSGARRRARGGDARDSPRVRGSNNVRDVERAITMAYASVFVALSEPASRESYTRGCPIP